MISRDLAMMGRIVLWLAFLLVMTPVAAAIFHVLARVVLKINYE